MKKTKKFDKTKKAAETKKEKEQKLSRKQLLSEINRKLDLVLVALKYEVAAHSTPETANTK